MNVETGENFWFSVEAPAELDKSENGALNKTGQDILEGRDCCIWTRSAREDAQKIEMHWHPPAL